VSIQHGILYEDCKRKREVEERFDRDYAAWKEQYPSKTFGQWLAQWGRGNGEQEIETEGEGEGEGGHTIPVFWACRRLHLTHGSNTGQGLAHGISFKEIPGRGNGIVAGRRLKV